LIACQSGCGTPNAWLNEHCQIAYPPITVAPPAISAATVFWIHVSSTFFRRTSPMSMKPSARDPRADLALRLAALTHDIERHFPGSPVLDRAGGRWDDPDYLFAHSTRSADLVGLWLAGALDAPEPALLREVRRLILLHELGGDRDADLIQAAESLSYLETLGPMTADWVRRGVCSAHSARAKLDWMFTRIRDERARTLAAPLHAGALRLVPDLEVAT
jgi:hypothetical protein